MDDRNQSDLRPLTTEEAPVVALGARNILVVEDDRSTRLLLVAALRTAGYAVFEAARLDEARALLSQHYIHLAVIDGLLPDGTGPDLIAELRAQHPHIKPVFLSAFFKDFRSHQQLRERHNVREILQKPVAPQKLLSSVESLLEPAMGRRIAG